MPREIRLNAFDMNCVGHQSSGMWRHPRDQSTRYTSMAYWQDLARTLERGLFDGVFLADVSGVYDVYQGRPDAALRSAAQLPANDPFCLVPVMATVTEHLCFGVTGCVPFEPPYAFARRLSTLDHLTDGRIGWNVVTGYLDSAARAVGNTRQLEHDQRYEMADEYMDVVYALWEGSWADDAVVRAPSGVYADPARVRNVRHRGKYYELDAIHLCEPSPQRTPVLYQAGSSPAGQAFAARHAECVFIGNGNVRELETAVAGLRRRARETGRTPGDLLVFAMLAVIVAPTDEEAIARAREYASYGLAEGGLALMSGWSGIDLAMLDHADTGQQAIESAQRALGRKTAAEWGEFLAIGGAAPVVVGSPATIADRMQEYMATGIDGFNLVRTVAPEGMTDFVDLVVPELQRRGIYKTAYASGTYREKLFGGGPTLKAPHPATRHRFEAVSQSAHKPA
jgi:alkanesulfonate monooxygenase